ncbi:MAG: hypothetical protein HPY50_01195 [Firmicutes bacterium]|nr:hypothetical protein [Bacillota bacterium]
MPEGKTGLVLFINFQFSNYQPLPAGIAAGFTAWVDTLEAAVYDHLNFNAGLLVAGPLLNALQAEEYHPALLRLRTLAASGQLGIIASPLDNNLVELSSRTDDFYYQLSNYAALAAMTFGVRSPSWEGIYCPQGRLSEHPRRSLGRVAAELNASPLLVVELEKPGTGDPGKDDSQSRIIILQEIAETLSYQAPVHLRYDAAGYKPGEVIGDVRGQGTGSVVVEVRLDFSRGPEEIAAGALCFEALAKELVEDPGIELLGFRDYLRRALGNGKVLDTRTPMPETTRHLLRDLEEQQGRLETQVLWNLRQRYPAAQDWLDLLGFGLADSTRRFEIMEELLSRYFPQTRLLAYRLLHRLRNLAYPDYFQEAAKYPKQQAILMLAQRLSRSQMALLNQRDPGQGMLEKRDWDRDGGQEMVISTERQELVVRPETGGVIYHRFVHPEVPVGSVELTYWIENRLKYGSGMDFTGYGALAVGDRNGWGESCVCFQTGESASPSIPAAIPRLEIEDSVIEGGGLEVRVSRREIHETEKGEAVVDIEQTYRLLDQDLEYRVRARVTPGHCQAFLGIGQPAAADGNPGEGRIQYIEHGSPTFSQGNTSRYLISPEEGADVRMTVRCEF